MEISERLKLGEEIVENIEEFLQAEINLQFNSKNLSFIDKVFIINEVMGNLFIRNIMRVSEITETDPIKVYELFNLHEMISSSMRDKNA
jgi:hypothetical protein